MGSNGWRETTIGALCDEGALHTQTGPFGSQLHSYDYVTRGIPVVPTEAIGRRNLVTDGIPQVAPQNGRTAFTPQTQMWRYSFRSARRSSHGSIGNRHRATGWLALRNWAILLRVTSNTIDPQFFSFLLSSDSAIAWLKQHAVGAVMPNLNEGVIRQLPIRIPPLAEQKAIAAMLGALDDKIELNQRMNRTLEAMARALFQSWFVDFDPVRAKLDGRKPTGVEPATAALLPNEFEDSELGPVPKGWEARPLSEIVDVVKGRSYRSEELAESKTALVTLKSFLRGGGYRADGLKPFTGEYKPNQRVQPGDLVVAFTDVTQAADVIGKPALIRSDDRFETLVASLDVGIVRPKSKKASIPFLYCLFLTEEFQAHTYSHTTGTTVLHLSSTAIPSFVSIVPPVAIAEQFAEQADPIFRLIDENAKQSRTLATLRDTLLPKLLSGELRMRSQAAA
jgi:type I restriction enzyme, S subunit